MHKWCRFQVLETYLYEIKAIFSVVLLLSLAFFFFFFFLFLEKIYTLEFVILFTFNKFHSILFH